MCFYTLSIRYSGLSSRGESRFSNPESIRFPRSRAENCGEAVTQSVVAAMAPPDVALRWSRYELQQFVNVAKVRRHRLPSNAGGLVYDSNHPQNMAWCPNPACGNAFVALGPVNSAQCSCGMRFCFRCSGEAHEPCRCAAVEKWKEKCGNDSETANWILSNTKKCPVCAVRIEKNQVCGLRYLMLPPVRVTRCEPFFNRAATTSSAVPRAAALSSVGCAWPPGASTGSALEATTRAISSSQPLGEHQL